MNEPITTIRQEIITHKVKIVTVARTAGVSYRATSKQIGLRWPLSPEVATALVKLVGHTADYWIGKSELLRNQ